VPRDRPCQDLSTGWGSNSQWGTDFRRDYVDGDLLRYNVDAKPDRFAPKARDDELLRHRCSVRAPALDDAFPYYSTAVEPALASCATCSRPERSSQRRAIGTVMEPVPGLSARAPRRRPDGRSYCAATRATKTSTTHDAEGRPVDWTALVDVMRSGHRAAMVGESR
jgi:hypothetical protein